MTTPLSTPELAIRVLPVRDGYKYQLTCQRTMKTLRPLAEHEAQAMMSELIPVIRIQSPNLQ
jgi:hypothetical protein